MNFFVGVTDNEWFDFLAARKPDEVNFWRPRRGGKFRAIEPGCPFLFKLHSPMNFIVGGGFFVRYSELPLSLAWKAFDMKNGAPDFLSLLAKISKYRPDESHDPMIGCIILNQPFFFDKSAWIPIPENWAPSIQRGKTYYTKQPIGRRLWDQVEERLATLGIEQEEELTYMPVGDREERFGSEYLRRARLGQGAFRISVVDAYSRRCAITGERTLPVLEASHIKPHGESGPNLVRNGLLLRSDLHTLFDRGYLTVTDDYHVEVSPRIREEYENGRDYYRMHGNRMQILPARGTDHPAPEFIEWHNEHIYLS